MNNYAEKPWGELSDVGPAPGVLQKKNIVI